MKLNIKKATTDVTVYVFIQNSSLTTGAGLTGLVYNSSSLVAYYVRPLGSATSISLATQTVTGAHSDGGFVEVDATNMPGLYRLDLPDAVCATGVNSVVVMLKGATNMAPVLLEIQLVSYDPNDTVRLGLTALPNAAADAAGGLPISDAGGLDLDSIKTETAAILVDTAEIGVAGAGLTNINLPDQSMNITGNITGNLSGSVGSVSGNVGGNVAGSIGSLATQAKADVNAEADTALADYDPPTRTELTSDINSVLSKVLKYFQLLFRKDAAIATDNATELTAINANGGSGAGAFDNTTESTEAIRDRGDAAWITATGFSTLDAAGVRTALGMASADLDTRLDAIVADTGEIGTAGAGLTALASAANLSTVSTNVNSILDDTGTSGVVVAAASKTGYALTAAYDPATTAAQAGDAMALTSGERNSTADAILARALAAESYAADGGTPTLSQMLWMLFGTTADFSISGTTLTVKKQDGTAAMTFTLDDATNPTSRTRAT